MDEFVINDILNNLNERSMEELLYDIKEDHDGTD